MKMMLAAAISVAMLAGTASAQPCASVGAQIAPVAFADAARSLTGGASLEKGEFETTAQYEARVAAARGTMPQSVWISVPIDLNYVTYNADNAAFAVKSFAIKNTNIDWFTALYGSPYYGTIRTASSNIDIVVSSKNRVTGSYQGKNAYGAEWEVSEIENTVEAIFEREGGFGDTIFQRGMSSEAPTWNVPVPVEQARGFKERMRAAVQIAPKAPYYFENTQSGPGRITIQNPRDVTQVSRIIIADIQCAVVTDDANNVLLSVPTN